MSESTSQFDPDDDPRTRPVESAGQAEALGVIAEAQGRVADADALSDMALDHGAPADPADPESAPSPSEER